MSIATALPAWATDILAAVPSRGDGLNRWLLRAAIVLLKCGRSPRETKEELRILTAGEFLKVGEIERAVTRAPEFITKAGELPRSQPAKWPEQNNDAIGVLLKKFDGFGAVDLWEQSPVRWFDDEPHTEEIIDRLFPGNPLICAAGPLHTATTRPREAFRDTLHRAQFIVPSAMAKPFGVTQEGRESPRCLDNVGPRQYLVVEQDGGTQDQQAAVIAHLAERAPLVLVVHSGGKSLHAWFHCAGRAEQVVKAFFGRAVQLGADPATWTPCQLVRMPDGTRQGKDGARPRQNVLYFNPAASQGVSA
ncbi:MAG: hypothetical protein ACOY3P_25565 [Planctomycetota bacterium]